MASNADQNIRKRRSQAVRRMIGILAFFSLTGIYLVFVFLIVINSFSGLRGFSTLQTHWIGTSKDTMHSLVRYVETGLPMHHAEFHDGLSILKDNETFRAALQAGSTNPEMIEELFSGTIMHPEDIRAMIKTYDRFQLFPHFESSMHLWTESNQTFTTMENIADEVHQSYLDSGLSLEEVQFYLSEISFLDQELNNYRDRIVTGLAEGSLLLKRISIWSSVIFFTALALTGILLTVWLIKGLRRWQYMTMFSEQRYKSLFNENPDGVFSFDLEGRFLTANENVAKMTECTVDELLQITFIPFVAPEDRLRVIGHYQKATQGESQNYNTRIITAKDNHLVVNIINMPIVVNEKIIGVYGIAKDITSKIKAEEEREHLIRQLNQNNKNLRQFSYITSHNIRAPLSNLLGLLDWLDDIEIQDKELREVLDGFRSSTRMLNTTIEDLSAILTIKDSTALEKEALVFEDVFNDVMLQSQNLIDRNKPVIKCRLTVPTVYFNKTYLESILLNLLTNAIKYRSPDRAPQITVTTESSGEYILLRFKDNGQGIDVKQYKERLFGLYQRFHDGSNSKGLGLYLVKSQMEAMGGSVRIRSKVNTGTVFTLKFRKDAVNISEGSYVKDRNKASA